MTICAQHLIPRKKKTCYVHILNKFRKWKQNLSLFSLRFLWVSFFQNKHKIWPRFLFLFTSWTRTECNMRQRSFHESKKVRGLENFNFPRTNIFFPPVQAEKCKWCNTDKIKFSSLSRFFPLKNRADIFYRSWLGWRGIFPEVLIRTNEGIRDRLGLYFNGTSCLRNFYVFGTFEITDTENIVLNRDKMENKHFKTAITRTYLFF